MAVATRARIQVDIKPFHPYLLRLYGVSEAEFESLADEDLKAEYLDGVMIVHSPATVRHEERQLFLATLLKLYADAHRMGRVLGGNAVFRWRERRLAPDVMVVRDEQRIGPKEVEGPPDLVVEVLSESTRDYDLGEKRRLYREAGWGSCGWWMWRGRWWSWSGGGGDMSRRRSMRAGWFRRRCRGSGSGRSGCGRNPSPPSSDAGR